MIWLAIPFHAFRYVSWSLRGRKTRLTGNQNDGLSLVQPIIRSNIFAACDFRRVLVEIHGCGEVFVA